ncbi:putative ABC exporter domain-containing protein [Faecalimonas sp.]
MRALLYVSKRSLVNFIKKAIKRPTTYLFLGVMMVYVIIFGMGVFVWRDSGIFTEKGSLVAILTIWTTFIFFSNFITYAKKKGILFKQSHAHFVFVAPISPKMILLMGAMKNYIFSIVVTLLIFYGELVVFQVNFLKAMLTSFGMLILELILEMSLVIFLYANETMSFKTTTWICRSLYVFLLGIVCVAIFYFRKNGMSSETLVEFIDYPVIQLIPILGWNISVYRMVFLGATTLNVVCSILYVLSVVGMFFIAYKMKCTGEYYEEAAKFADDYAEFRKKSKNGEMVMTVGRKKNFKKSVKLDYKVSGAKTIFYRQLLEYKKEKFFIFGGMTCLVTIIALLFIKVIGIKDGLSPQMMLLLIMAYIIFCTTGYTGKWEKELKTPYLYLIPDTPIKKMWYATMIEHIRSFVDGSILAIIIGIAWKIPVFEIILAILIYVVLQANKLYIRILVESILSASAGVNLRNIFCMLFQSAILSIGGILGGLVSLFISAKLLFPIIFIYSILMVSIIALLASSRFCQMEKRD